MIGLAVRRDWYPLIAGVLVVVVFELVLILWTTHGNFTYTLDDAYIHLALAENLARFGHYGLNLEEYSSPSSSILWPLLLIPLLAAGIGAYGPLVLNVPFAVASVLVIHQLIIDAAKWPSQRSADISWAWALLVFLMINGFGVIFTGMEHSLHILVTALILYFINRIQLAADRGVAVQASGYGDSLLAFCIVLSPLIRFEGLAVSLFAIAMVIRCGKARLAAVSGSLLLLSLASYFYVMSTLGLPWLPSSVLVKSSVAADVASQGGLFAKLHGAYLNTMGAVTENLSDGEGGLLLLLIAALVAGQALRARLAGERISVVYAIGALAVIALHFAFGRFGWYGRYQCYVFVFAIGAALYVFSGSLSRQHASSRLLPVGACVMLALLLLTAPGFRQAFFPLMTTPVAAQNIYEHQRQMHEFVARHWKAPVAVNDIGYVAFQNDAYVLDLWGLGSEEARRLRRAGDPDMLHKLTERHDVHFAMIYEDVFSIPADWRKLAELRLSTRRITASSDRVSFFVFGLDQARCAQVSARLAEFARALPRPQMLAVDSEACNRPEIPPVVRSAAG